jgi:subtilisin family serine protease
MLKSILRSVQVTSVALLLCAPQTTWAQNNQDKLSQQVQAGLLTTSAKQTITLFVYFKDKGINIDEKLAAAKSSLSKRALQRRTVNRGANNVVSYNDIPIEPVYLELVSKQAAKVRHSLKALNAISIEATPEAIANILKYDFVAKIDLVKQLKRTPGPQEIIPKAQPKSMTGNKELLLDYGNSFTQNDQINVPTVHDMGYTGNGVVIAVFDSGFNRLSHESFSQITIADTWDFVNDDSDVGDGADMGSGSHGTYTLSTIGGFSEGNLIGPAYGATYYLAKTENNESELHVEEDNWCAAAEWADTNGAQIISSSLGYTDFDSGTDYTFADMDGETTIVTLCADLAAENGIVVVNSAGNSGPGEGTLGAPSDGNHVIGVGAVTSSGGLSSFSSMGPSSDGRVKPDVAAMGSSVLVASASSDSVYTNVNGTSFSCPLTAGVAALVLESNPNLSAEQVRDILRNTADRNSNPDTSFGYGIINALAAVEAAVDATGGVFEPNASFAIATGDSTAINFTSTSTDSDGTVDSYAWDFGDNETSDLENPSHTYSTGGTYTVTLTVTDNSSLTDMVSRTVTVASSGGGGTTQPPASSSSGGGSFGLFLLTGLALLSRSRKRR